MDTDPSKRKVVYAVVRKRRSRQNGRALLTIRLSPTPDNIARAAEVLRAGGLVAFPTETVYGLGARADSGDAVARIFEAKGRPATNPLIVHVTTIDEARALASGWSDVDELLAKLFWPGPLTLIACVRAGAVAPAVTASGATIALRCPRHAIATELLRAVGAPIAAPSANRSTTVSPTTADLVLKTLRGRIDAVLDAGATGFGIESTIVDTTTRPATLLRPGSIALSEPAKHIEVVDRSARVESVDTRSPAPGGYARHYAPNAHVVVVPADVLDQTVTAARTQYTHVGILGYGNCALHQPCSETLPDTPTGYAREFYAAMHRLEDAGCTCIIVAEPPAGDGWHAVRDRLIRAASEPQNQPADESNKS